MIALFGDYIHDIYHFGKVEKISPESPIPVFQELYVEERSGGAGNVHSNLLALGSQVKFWYSDNSTKHRFVCNNHILFRSDQEKYVPYEGKIDYDLTGIKLCILSDYNKGYLSRSRKLIEYCKKNGCMVIVDPKKDLDNYRGANIIKLNASELEKYTEERDPRSVLWTYDIDVLIVTRGKDGVMKVTKDSVEYFTSKVHSVSDVTGAGDVFLASLVYFMSVGKDLSSACQKATDLASISVTKFGTYTLQPEDIKQLVDESIRTGVRHEVTPQVGIHFMRFCGKYELNKISEQADAFARWLNAPYQGVLDA